MRDFKQVSTNGEIVLAKQISWVMPEIRDILSGYIDFQNKYQFYGEIADAVQRQLQMPYVNHKDVFIAVVNAAEKFRNEWRESTEKYFERRQILLEVMERFAEEHERSVVKQ